MQAGCFGRHDELSFVLYNGTRGRRGSNTTIPHGIYRKKVDGEYKMFLYFWKRLLHKKNFYLALLAGAMLSMLYIAKDVYPYRAVKIWTFQVYTIGWEVLTGQIYASLFYHISAIACSNTNGRTRGFLTDKAVIINLCRLEIRAKQYFRGLYVCNFTAGGLVTIFPLAINLYACFLLVPDEKPEFVLWDTHTVSLYGK